MSDVWEARLALSVLAEPGDAELAWLIEQAGPVSALQSIREHTTGLRDLEKRLAPRLPSLDRDILRVTDEISRHEIAFITPEMHVWPAQLNDLEVPPIGLYLRGVLPMGQGTVAMVGARAASGYGEHVTELLVSELAAAGFRSGIISGGAYGIDGRAHRSAMWNDIPTVAYMAGGLDRLYPAGHVSLLESIVRNNGCLLSEVAPGSGPTRWRFLQRNRLIAAHSAALIVVEAGMRSGSLNAAGHARGIGRPLGAVPGPVTSAVSAGTHQLIKEGARIITSGQDIVEMVASQAIRTGAAL